MEKYFVTNDNDKNKKIIIGLDAHDFYDQRQYSPLPPIFSCMRCVIG